jgi:hypothetical protein
MVIIHSYTPQAYLLRNVSDRRRSKQGILKSYLYQQICMILLLRYLSHGWGLRRYLFHPWLFRGCARRVDISTSVYVTYVI